MNPTDWFTWVLTTVGALNWGLVGLASFNLVDNLFGRDTFFGRFVYTLVGMAGLWSIYRLVQANTRARAETPITRIFSGRY